MLRAIGKMLIVALLAPLAVVVGILSIPFKG
jgi:hypothetical protein